MATLFEKIKQLREEANALQKKAEAEMCPQLKKQFGHIVGKCFKVTEKSSGDEWIEYVKITEIEDFHNFNGDVTVSIKTTRVIPNMPGYGAQILEYEHSYYHIILEYGKEITTREFNKARLKVAQKLLEL